MVFKDEYLILKIFLTNGKILKNDIFPDIQNGDFNFYQQSVLEGSEFPCIDIYRRVQEKKETLVSGLDEVTMTEEPVGSIPTSGICYIQYGKIELLNKEQKELIDIVEE